MKKPEFFKNDDKVIVEVELSKIESEIEEYAKKILVMGYEDDF